MSDWFGGLDGPILCEVHALPGCEECTQGNVAALAATVEAIALKFKSGNAVPVDRVTITRKEWEAMCNGEYR